MFILKETFFFSFLFFWLYLGLNCFVKPRFSMWYQNVVYFLWAIAQNLYHEAKSAKLYGKMKIPSVVPPPPLFNLKSETLVDELNLC